MTIHLRYHKSLIEDASCGNGNMVIDTENHQNLVTDEVCSSKYRVLRDATEARCHLCLYSLEDGGVINTYSSFK